MDGWNTIVSFWGPAYFQVLLLLVSGRVISPHFRGDEAQFGLISFVRCHRDRVLCFSSRTGKGKDSPGTSRAVQETSTGSKSAGCKNCRLQICPLHQEKLTWFIWKSPKLKRKVIWINFFMSLGSILNSGGVHFWKQSATQMVRTKSNLKWLGFSRV